MLAIALGGIYGWIERWAAVVPLLSARGLFAITVASFSFQSEFAAGVYAAACYRLPWPCLIAFSFRDAKTGDVPAVGTQMPSAAPP